MTFKICFILWSIFCFQYLFSTESIYTDEEGCSPSGHKMVYHRDDMKTKDVIVSISLTPSLCSYIQMISEMPVEEQLRLLIKDIPTNVEEALDLLVREILLYQQIFLQQIKAIEAMKARPSEHQVLALHFQKFKFEPWMVYREAKLSVAWCNMLVRYVGWVSRNPEKQRLQHIDRLFGMLFTMYQTTLMNAESGLDHILRHLKGRYSPAYALILFKCRETNLKPSNIRQTVWFHDNVTPGLLFYSATCHILMPFITESTFTKSFQMPENDYNFPKELATISDISCFKIGVKSRKSSEPTLKAITDTWTELGKMDAYKVVTDWRDERVTDLAFEKSYIDPLDQKRGKKEQNLTKAPILDLNPIQKGSKGKKKKGKKRRVEKKKKPPQDDISTTQTELPNEALESFDEAAVEPIIKIESTKIEISFSLSASEAIRLAACDENLENTSSSDDLSEKISSSNDSPSLSSSPCSETKFKEMESDETKVEEPDDDWEEEVKRETERRKQYAMEKKISSRVKVIKQQEKDRIESEYRSRIRNRQTSFSSSSSKESKTTDVIRLDSTELCLTYPESYSIFLSNKNICSYKAKSFRWYFDPNVVIKQKHMDFLCALFNLESGKTRLNFSNMKKAFWAIEKCFYEDKASKDIKKVKRTNFEWSHRFEINDVLVSPIKKDIHAEHLSSRFNHTHALALFSRGGFDPRFFNPED